MEDGNFSKTISDFIAERKSWAYKAALIIGIIAFLLLQLLALNAVGGQDAVAATAKEKKMAEKIIKESEEAKGIFYENGELKEVRATTPVLAKDGSQVGLRYELKDGSGFTLVSSETIKEKEVRK